MDNNGFKIVNKDGHYELYRYDIFKCSGDTKKEIEEEMNNIMKLI